jgi:hypothetical protein
VCQEGKIMAKMYDTATVSKALGASYATLCQWRAKGVGPEWTKRGRYYCYPADQFEAYLNHLGPVPADMDAWTRRRFFENAHSSRPEVIAEPVAPETPEHKDTVADLKRRLEVIEVAVVLLGGQAHG